MTKAMMAVEDSIHESDFILLNNCFDKFDIALKIEGLNLADSIKLKTAKALLNYAEKNHGLAKKKKFIESSSGNLGVALAMMAANRDYSFTCVVDPNTNETNISIMTAMGAHVVVVNERDESGGYLGTRKKYIKNRLNNENDLIWLNQYECIANPEIHAHETAFQIHKSYPGVERIYVGAGTTGTAMGLTDYFKKNKSSVSIVAVDSVGSVTFGNSASPRYLPGLGASVPPVFFKAQSFDRLIQVPECMTIAVSRYIARRYGLLLGASSCTVLAGMYEDEGAFNKNLVAISPDLGTKYVHTMYNDGWCDERFGDEWRKYDFAGKDESKIAKNEHEHNV